MLDYALAHVQAHGHTDVLVNAHYLWEQVAVWAEANGVALQVELPVILGTGGGLRAALPDQGPAVVIVNADILSDVDLTSLVDAVPEGGAAMALRPSPDATDIGPVEADESGRVVRITSVVPSDDGRPGTHFTGVHAMSRAAVGLIPDEGERRVTVAPAARTARPAVCTAMAARSYSSSAVSSTAARARRAASNSALAASAAVSMGGTAGGGGASSVRAPATAALGPSSSGTGATLAAAISRLS